MSKVIRTAALVVGAAALIVATAGFGSALAAGGTLSAASAAAGTATVAGLSASTLGVISTGLGLVGALTAKKPGGSAGGSPTSFKADPYAGVPYLIGRTFNEGNIVFRRSADGFAGHTNNDLQDFVVILSGAGPIEAIESFRADSVTYTFDGAGNAIGDYHDYMWLATQLGAMPEPSALAVAAGSSASPTGWTSDHKLSGLAAAMWRIRYDTKGKRFPGGVPQNPGWVCKGVKCYDPRKDDTYPGGSGSHRWADPADVAAHDAARETWEFSENPYLHGLKWALGSWERDTGTPGSPYVRTHGIGASIDQVIVADFVEGANIADANGWKAGGVVYSRPDPKWTVLKSILQAGGGEPVQAGGRIGCLVNTPRVSLATVTIGDIVGDCSLAATQPRRSRINGVSPQIRLESDNWAKAPRETVRVAEFVAEDGDERTKEIDYSLVQDVTQGAQLAAYDICNSREFGPGTFPMKPYWLNYKAGDCVTFDTPELAQKMMILTRSFDPATGIVTFTMRSETDSKHAYCLAQTAVAPSTPSTAAPPVVPAPDPSAWTLTGSTNTGAGGSVPVLVIEGALDYPPADAIIFEYRPHGTTDWIAAGVEAPSMIHKEITGVTPGTAYDVAVSYRARGSIGAQLVLGPATAGVLASSSSALADSATTADTLGSYTPTDIADILARLTAGGL